MPQYFVLNGFCIKSGEHASPGEVLDIPDEENGARPQLVREWLHANHIRPLLPTDKVKPDEVKAPTPAVVNREPKIERR